MQMECEHCGETLSISKAFNKRRRDIIKSPKSFKIIICPNCKQKNYLNLKNI